MKKVYVILTICLLCVSTMSCTPQRDDGDTSSASKSSNTDTLAGAAKDAVGSIGDALDKAGDIIGNAIDENKDTVEGIISQTEDLIGQAITEGMSSGDIEVSYSEDLTEPMESSEGDTTWVEPTVHRDEMYLSMSESDINSMNADAIYHSKKKYPVSITLYRDGELCFETTAGINVFGNTSVEYDKKSYKVKFSAKYGPKKLKYKLFDNLDIYKFDSFVLRSGSQDIAEVMLKDEFIPELMRRGGVGEEVLTAAYRPVSLYINDEYRGLYYIREHMDESMIASHYGCEDEEVTLIEQHKEVKCGDDGDEWLDFWKWVDSHDLSDPECYEHVKETVSLESVADYYIIQLWLHNVDPDNVRVYKAGDGLWRYALYDLDLTLCDDGSGSVSSLIGRYNKGLYTFNALIYKLLENDEFRDYFTQRAKLLYDTVFSYDNVVSCLDDYTARIDAAMKGNCDFWGGHKDSSGKVSYPRYETWQKHLDKLKNRLDGRTDRIKDQLTSVKKLEFK